jgi:hypothetical protein
MILIAVINRHVTCSRRAGRFRSNAGIAATAGALFVTAAGAAAIGAWRLNEDVRSDMTAANLRLEKVSETDALTELGNRRGQASTIEAALRTADNRLYAHKHGSRASSSRQSADVLVQALAEHHPDLAPHVDAVTTFAAAIAEHLGLDQIVVEQVGHAAELHDIGKVAIPDAIISKPGPLNDQEWQFMRRHTPSSASESCAPRPHWLRSRCSYDQATNATTAAAIPMVSWAIRFPSAPGSFASATPTTQ